MPGFVERLNSAALANQSLVCVGLDPDPNLMAIEDVAEFNARIIDASHDLVCAYKPNFPFYEALGIPGLEALERTVEHIRKVAPGVALIADCKRGDIARQTRCMRALCSTLGDSMPRLSMLGAGETR